MYGIVLAAALTTGATSADWCKGCCKGCCSCSCYSCWCSCYGGYGCHCGGYCHGCCHGCWTTCGCYGCHGYCSGGWCCSCCSCGGYIAAYCHGCYGCCAAISYGCVGCAMPAIGGTVVEGGVIIGGEVRAPAVNAPATVVVKAAKDIKLKVNGSDTPRKGDEESYTSPALVSGRTYSYTFVAEGTVDGKPVTETKEVTVYAGRTSTVDFSNFGKEVAKAEEAATASVTVVLPENAKVTVNDVAINVSGKQTFTTPKLEKGKSYFYTVKAEIVRDGKPVTETRKIDVAAGKEVTIDFTANAKLTASR